MNEILKDQPFLITPTHLLAYNFCPRFVYFEYVLHIPEREEKHFKVMKGREVHKTRYKTNPHYLRKKFGVIERMILVRLCSSRLHLSGEVDEVLLLEDQSMAPLDYKYSYDRGVFPTQQTQLVLYALLIEENFSRVVHKGFLCYTRDNYKIVTVSIDEKLKNQALGQLYACVEIIQREIFPEPTKFRRACNDCVYRNLCIH